jgi:hypothetical protein
LSAPVARDYPPPLNGGFRVLITGPHGVAVDDELTVIAERVREPGKG